MARARSRKRSGTKQNKNVSVVTNKAEIAAMIDARRLEQDVKSTSNKREVNTFVDEKLEKEFKEVLQRFQAQKHDAVSKEVGEQKDNKIIIAEEKPVSTRDTKYASENELEDASPDRDEESSTRKRRKLEKPSLSQLKSQVPYPQIIEWYDCDANYPDLLASIKCTKNVIPVPNHWQSKKEYLSGRSLLGKKPFELPDIIKKTNIEQMRSTLPQSGLDAQDEKSLKEASRARVQPKMGTLDLDYKKLHDIFFKLGANWRPDHLLSFGDVYYENRNLFEEASWKRMVDRKRPGRISKELRAIMNLPEGQLPPWCMKMKDHGLPTGYPDLKIAGLNWDITNMKGEVYGRIIPHGQTRLNKQARNYFGALISFETPEFETAKEDIAKNTGDEAQERDINAETEHKLQYVQKDTSNEISLEEKLGEVEEHIDRQLYTVLK
ncbi:cus1p [Saccharomyces arboricola H-6]|uniref:Cus1p n=1 Tax=Saccharomyces arboricola (strain H-6 / AS 2.3317 / CBS 10644) TaxID=1160507 RepID=J8LQ25_SACAR|nr:cus1p [Saccharomyces arboricola H-6]